MITQKSLRRSKPAMINLNYAGVKAFLEKHQMAFDDAQIGGLVVYTQEQFPAMHLTRISAETLMDIWFKFRDGKA